MRFIKPAWLTHSGEQKDFEVYSCHVSPDGSRLATAAGDGHVRIWSTAAIENAGNPLDPRPKQLCHMSYHSGTIHTVRFSPNGRWLASGADDKIICIYHLDTNPPAHSASFGTSEPPPVENWKILRRLIGHDNDVQDLGWSYDSSILVSVGLDSKVVVWSGTTFEKLKTLSNHQSHVKGITFDPANKYFATASDDRTIKIFRFSSPLPHATAHDMVNNFVLEHTIQAPFVTSPLTTYFRRCSWSPDGNHIAAANAVNGPVSTVAIINRTAWDSDINLIGHENPVEVCMFSPRLFSAKPLSPETTDNKGFSTQHLVTVIACAGQDKSLSVWNTSTSRPLLITQNLAAKSISDLAWTPDGQTLYATSLDGSIIAVVFEDGDLGFVARMEENEKSLSKYGVGRKGVGVIEDVASMRLEERSKAGELRGAEGRMGALMGDGPSKPTSPMNMNGSGTNTPMAGGLGSMPPQPVPQPQNPAVNGRPTLGEPRPTFGEPRPTGGSPRPMIGEPRPSLGEQARPIIGEPQPPPVDPNAASIEPLKQRVTITKEGKKRVQPLLVSSSGTGRSSLPQSQLMASASNHNHMEAPQTTLDLSKPFDGLPRGGITTLLMGNKRKAIVLDSDEEDHQNKRMAMASANGVVPIMMNGAAGLEPAVPVPPQNGILLPPEWTRPAVVNSGLVVSHLRLAIPKIRAKIVRSLDRGIIHTSAKTNGTNGAEESSKVSEEVMLEVKNPAQLRDPAHVIATKRGNVLWQEFLPRPVILITGNKIFWSAACEDGSVYVWTPAGRRLLNALVLEAQPVIIECRGWWLLCITATGTCYVWNIKTLSSPHPPISLAPILDVAVHSLQPHLTSGPGVTSAHLNSQGRIVVTLNTGDGYSYSPEMFIWQRLSEAWWAVGSQYWNSNDSSVSSLQSTSVGPRGDSSNGNSADKIKPANISAGIIPHLERHTTNEVLLKGRAYNLQRLIKTLLSKEGFESFESGVSIAHLENRVAAALMLGARDEFRLYLFMYAKRLGAEGLKGKVEELLRDLLGGILREKKDVGEIFSTGGGEVGMGWNSEGEEICGWDRRELLKGVVLILGKFRELQRTTVQYARVLEVLDDEEDGGGGGGGGDTTTDPTTTAASTANAAKEGEDSVMAT